MHTNLGMKLLPFTHKESFLKAKAPVEAIFKLKALHHHGYLWSAI